MSTAGTALPPKCPGCDEVVDIIVEKWRVDDGPCKDDRFWCLSADCQKDNGCGCTPLSRR